MSNVQPLWSWGQGHAPNLPPSATGLWEVGESKVDLSEMNLFAVLIPKFPDRKLYSLYVWQTPSAATLKINYASLEHRGLYQCVAENSYGSDVFTMSIHLDKGEL